MKKGFFLKLARSNISKNRRFFLPRILSEAGLLCVFYIVFTLRDRRTHPAAPGRTIH